MHYSEIVISHLVFSVFLKAISNLIMQFTAFGEYIGNSRTTRQIRYPHFQSKQLFVLSGGVSFKMSCRKSDFDCINLLLQSFALVTKWFCSCKLGISKCDKIFDKSVTKC